MLQIDRLALARHCATAQLALSDTTTELVVCTTFIVGPAQTAITLVTICTAATVLHIRERQAIIDDKDLPPNVERLKAEPKQVHNPRGDLIRLSDMHSASIQLPVLETPPQEAMITAPRITVPPPPPVEKKSRKARVVVRKGPVVHRVKYEETA